MDSDTWLYSKVIATPTVDGFDLENEELPVFLIKSNNIKTLVTTRRIIEISGIENKSVMITDIEKVNYDNPKGYPGKILLSTFKIIRLNGAELHFQFETGAAAVGLIYSINTLRTLSK